MLRRVAIAVLPRDPQEVRLLHHTQAGVVIAAVRYAPSLSAAAAAIPSGKGPLFFTVVEMRTPNERGLPLRTVHVRVPRPANVVNAITLVRSPDGVGVYVVVQAAHVPAAGAAPKSIITYVYRRQVVDADRSEGSGVMKQGLIDDDEDLVSSPQSTNVGYGSGAAADLRTKSRSPAADGAAGVRVRYQRMPRTAAGADAQLWTATAAFSTAENVLAVGAANASEAAFVTVSSTNGNEGDGGNQLQLWSLAGTRARLDATVTIPALAGFPIEQILTLPGTQDVALLRHHNALLEVNLSGVRSACAAAPQHHVTSNAYLTRAWRWSPHQPLTASAVKDALLYAATGDGSVLVWDLRQPSSSGQSAPLRSPSVKTPITGLYAPYATGFVTCDASGGVRDWQEVGQNDDDDEEASGGGGGRPLLTVGDAAANEEANVARSQPSSAAESTPFPYRSRAPMEAPSGAEGCVSLAGQDNFVAMVGECGRLCLYFCD